MDGVETKFIEVRDEGTTIVCMVTAVNRRDMHDDEGHDKSSEWMLYRGGWGKDTTGLYFSTICPTEPVWAIGAAGSSYIDHYSPGYKGSRTFIVAWPWIQQHWDELETGDLVDVEYILKLQKSPKVTERVASTVYRHEWD